MTRLRRKARHFILLAGIGCWMSVNAIATDELQAASGDLFIMPRATLPNPGVAGTPGAISPVPQTTYSKSGFQIVVDTRGIGEYGYRPVRVQLNSRTKTTADHQVTVRFSAANIYMEPRPITVEKDFEFPMGQTSASTMFLVPQFVDWFHVRWEVWIDGQIDSEIGAELSSFSGGGGGGSRAVLALQFPEANSASSSAGISPLRTSQFSSGILNQLFGKWTEYSHSDLVLTSLKDLEKFRSTHPQGIRVLLRWVRSGGNLWILDGGRSYENVPAIDRLLELQPEDESASDLPPSVPTAWKVIQIDLSKAADNEGFQAIYADRESSGLQKKSVKWKPFSRPEDVDSDSDSYSHFVVRPYGIGTVTVCRSNSRYRSALVREALDKAYRSPLIRWMNWSVRHGNNPNMGNEDFNNFLIPDVGLAPVYEFMVLITLFVLGIGPLNYWVFRRRGKLPMVLATVPTAAVLTTVLLFVYGFLNEGVGTQVRVRSYAFLDQRVGEVASWSRLSFYAGIAPADGLSMPVDTLIYPILPNASRERSVRRYANQPRLVMWEASGSGRLTEGWLPSRTPVQYLSMTARASKKQVRIEEVDEGLRVMNQLQTDIVMLVVCDRERNYYLGENIAVGESVLLASLEKADAISPLRKLFAEREPQFPVGAEVPRAENSHRARVDSGLLEANLKSIGAPSSKEWNGKTYVAVTKEGIAVETGLDDIEEQQSFHVVRGNW